MWKRWTLIEKGDSVRKLGPYLKKGDSVRKVGPYLEKWDPI